MFEPGELYDYRLAFGVPTNGEPVDEDVVEQAVRDALEALGIEMLPEFEPARPIRDEPAD